MNELYSLLFKVNYTFNALLVLVLYLQWYVIYKGYISHELFNLMIMQVLGITEVIQSNDYVTTRNGRNNLKNSGTIINVIANYSKLRPNVCATQ